MKNGNVEWDRKAKTIKLTKIHLKNEEENKASWKKAASKWHK